METREYLLKIAEFLDEYVDTPFSSWENLNNETIVEWLRECIRLLLDEGVFTRHELRKAILKEKRLIVDHRLLPQAVATGAR